MFTLADLTNIALQIEKNGYNTYLKASQTSQDPELSAMFSWMANEEAQHEKWFAQLQSATPLNEEARQAEAMGKELLQQMIKGNEFLLAGEDLYQAEDQGQVIEQSKQFEQDTIVFYEFLLALLDNDDAKAHLRRIIAEEQGHLDKLQAIGTGRLHVPGVQVTL